MPTFTENVGSFPRPVVLQAALKAYDADAITRKQLVHEQDGACRDSMKRMEAIGAPIVSDGEQRVSSFAAYLLTDTLAGTGLAGGLAGDRLGSTDDCGFLPFSIDVKPKHGSSDAARNVAFEKIRARVQCTRMASDALGVS